MSAWVVSHHHIDLLISAAIDCGIVSPLQEPGIPEQVTEANAQAFGLMLWAENIRSVVHLYRLSGTEEGENYRRVLAGYRFGFYPGIRVAASAKALACYHYQTCECPDYRDTAAALFVRLLTEAIGEEPEGYDNEPWGFDTEAQVRTAQGGAK